MRKTTKMGVTASANLIRGAGALVGSIGLVSIYEVECFAPDGRLKWRDVSRNLVVNEGLDDVLDIYFKGSGYTAAFYVGLTGATPSFAPGDTMASHPGWTEFTNYSEASRRVLVLGAVSGQSVDNSASKATYTISQDGQTIGGSFVTTDPTKGGSAGKLYGGAAFASGNKGADTNDVLNVTVTLTAAAAP